MSQDLKNRILDEVKQAMRSRDKERLSALRLIQAAIKQKEVDSRQQLSDQDILAILGKLSKQYQDSINQFEQAGRDDLVSKENFELQIVQEFLPTPLDFAELKTVIDKTIAELGASTMKDMGKVMQQLKTELEGKADFVQVSAIVKDCLSG